MRGGRALLTLLLLLWHAWSPVQAQPADEPKVSLSGYLQPQLTVEHRDGGTRDRTLLRRMVITVVAELTPNWHAEIQADAGPLTAGGDRLVVKNALIRYNGWEDRGIVFTVGNQKTPFSRSLLASSSHRGLVERPFTGDRAFGSPGRAVSIRVDGWHRARTVFWSAAVAETRHGPDPEELRLDGAAEMGDGGNEGHMATGRLEFHPLGETTRDHGDFAHGELRFTVGGGAYLWRADGDTTMEPGRPDADRISGLEISGALRGGGLSIDAEFEHLSAHARRPLSGGGLYGSGDTSVRKGSVEAGYMVLRERLEILAGLDALDTPSFARAWQRLSAGINWYIKRHDLKFSMMHRESFNTDGLRTGRSRAAYLQAQLAF